MPYINWLNLTNSVQTNIRLQRIKGERRREKSESRPPLYFFPAHSLPSRKGNNGGKRKRRNLRNYTISLPSTPGKLFFSTGLLLSLYLSFFPSVSISKDIYVSTLSPSALSFYGKDSLLLFCGL